MPAGAAPTAAACPTASSRATTTLLSSLDAGLRDRSTLDRLELVISGFAEVLNGAAWTVSYAEHGSAAIQSVSSADDRDSRLRGVRVGLETEQFELREFPLTGQLVAAGSGSFIVDRYDRDADAAERALLVELGYSSVLAAAASDLGGVYLLEIYGDGDTAALAGAALRLELLGACGRRGLGRDGEGSPPARQAHQAARDRGLAGHAPQRAAATHTRSLRWRRTSCTGSWASRCARSCGARPTSGWRSWRGAATPSRTLQGGRVEPARGPGADGARDARGAKWWWWAT